MLPAGNCITLNEYSFNGKKGFIDENFMDTADVDEIVGMAELGIVYGVTTNPSLIAKSGRTQAEVIPQITNW